MTQTQSLPRWLCGFNLQHGQLVERFSNLFLSHSIPGSQSWGCFPHGSDSDESACKAGESRFCSWAIKIPEEENGSPHQHSHPENSMERGAWRAIVHGVAKTQTNWATNTFTFPFSMWVLHRSLLPRLPWRTWVCSSEDRLWRRRGCLYSGDPSSTECSGKRALEIWKAQEIRRYEDPCLASGRAAAALGVSGSRQSQVQKTQHY